MVVKEGTKETDFNLTTIRNSETMLKRRPNQYKTDWKNNISYTVEKTQGVKNLTLTVSKSYKDFKGRVVELSSAKESTRVVNVVYDTIAPTGTIMIQAEKQPDGSYEVPSHEVKLDLTFEDENSGVEKVKVKEGNKEYELSPQEVAKGKVTIPWTLGLGKDGQVFMEITDKAGNTREVPSNKVTVSNIFVTGFDLTDVVNPAVNNFPANGYRWQFDGNHVHMIAGGNFSFNIYYGIGYVNPDRYIVSGEYQVTIIDGNKEVYRSDIIPYTQGFDENNSTGDAGFTATFTLPKVDKNGQPFNDGAKVYLSSTLERHEKANGKKLYATFENPNSGGNLIGVMGHYGGATSIDDMVRFNEKN